MASCLVPLYSFAYSLTSIKPKTRVARILLFVEAFRLLISRTQIRRYTVHARTLSLEKTHCGFVCTKESLAIRYRRKRSKRLVWMIGRAEGRNSWRYAARHAQHLVQSVCSVFLDHECCAACLPLLWRQGLALRGCWLLIFDKCRFHPVRLFLRCGGAYRPLGVSRRVRSTTRKLECGLFRFLGCKDSIRYSLLFNVFRGVVTLESFFFS